MQLDNYVCAFHLHGFRWVGLRVSKYLQVVQCSRGLLRRIQFVVVKDCLHVSHFANRCIYPNYSIKGCIVVTCLTHAEL